MPATTVHRGDIVFVSHRGRLFYAKVLGAGVGAQLTVEPLDRAVLVRAVRVSEVLEHFSRSSAADPGPAVGQISLAELDGWDDHAPR